MIMMFITRGRDGLEVKNEEAQKMEKARRCEGMGREESASRALMRRMIMIISNNNNNECKAASNSYHKKKERHLVRIEN